MAITELLQQILSARYGRDVRQSIHDAIKTCYDDGKAGATDLEAREALNNFKFKTENTVKKVYNPATQNWENFGGGGGGASTWSEIENKPFATVGAGLDVKNNALIVNENITKELNDLGDDVEQLNKDLNGFAFKTEDNEKKVYNPSTEAWEDFGGGSGASTWSEVADKPFETIGDGLKVESNVLKADVEPYELPIASTTTLGGVKADGTTTTIDADGTIHASGGGSADMSVVADDWQNKGYDKGANVIDEGIYYECLLTHTSGLKPKNNATYWKATNSGNQINQLNNDLSEIHKNTISGSTDITSYNSQSNLFTVPADGYIRITTTGVATNQQGVVRMADGSAFSRVTPNGVNNQINTTFVRKGMKFYIEGGGAYALYYEYK